MVSGCARRVGYRFGFSSCAPAGALEVGSWFVVAGVLRERVWWGLLAATSLLAFGSCGELRGRSAVLGHPGYHQLGAPLVGAVRFADQSPLGTRPGSLACSAADVLSGASGQLLAMRPFSKGPRPTAKRQLRPSVQLGSGRLAATTVKRYARQVQALEAFVRSLEGPSLSDMLQSGALQAILVWSLLYLQVGYDSTLLSLSDAGSLVAGLHWHLQRLLVLVPAAELDIEPLFKPLRKAYGHWAQLEPYEFRAPVPSEVALALVGWFVHFEDFGAAAAVLLMFHCLLRPGEAFGVASGDVWFGFPGLVRIGRPKMKWPRTQHVLIECRFVFCFLQHFCASWDQASLGGELTAASWFYKAWSRALAGLGLPCHAFPDRLGPWLSPAGLRAGGATRHYFRFQNLPGLQWRGRWRNLSTLEHYVQLGAYYWNKAALDPLGAARVGFYGRFAVRFLHHLYRSTAATHPPDGAFSREVWKDDLLSSLLFG